MDCKVHRQNFCNTDFHHRHPQSPSISVVDINIALMTIADAQLPQPHHKSS